MITAAAFVLLAAAGALTRWLGRSFVTGRVGQAVATLVVNLSGAFALGFVVVRASDPVITAIGIGGLGTYTTFSTLVGDVVALTADGRRWAATGYLVASVAGGVALADLGLRLGG
ncbi:MAG: fluoride efflux transporter FluC [Acidimicrobiales bacterium]